MGIPTSKKLCNNDAQQNMYASKTKKKEKSEENNVKM